MPTSTEVAGISIGIAADTKGLEASLEKANSAVGQYQKRWRNRIVNVTVEAKKGQTWNGIENDLKAMVQRVAKGTKVPIDIDFEIPKDKIADLRTKVQQEVSGKLTGIKIPVDIDFKAAVEVSVKWHWEDGEGPPGNLDVGVTPRGGGTPPPSTNQGRRRATSGTAEVITPSATQSPPKEPAKPRATPHGTIRVRGTVAAPPAPEPQAPEAKKSGIAGMGTAIPHNAAKRAKEAVIAANTEAAGLSETWIRTTRKMLESMGAKIPSGAKAPFEHQFLRGDQTGGYRYQIGGIRHAVLPGSGRPGQRPAPAASQFVGRPEPDEHELTVRKLMETGGPDIVAGLIALGRETKDKMFSGRIDPRRGLADRKSMAGFDPGGGVGAERTEADRKAFSDVMAAHDDDLWKRLEPLFGTSTRKREDIIRDFGGTGKKGKSEFSLKRIESIRKALQVTDDQIEHLDKLRAEGKTSEFFGSETEPGALMARAGARGDIIERALQTAQKKTPEGVLTDQEYRKVVRKANLHVEALRAGHAMPVAERPEEGRYVHLTALIGDAFEKARMAEEKANQAQATEKGQTSRTVNEATAQFVQRYGERPMSSDAWMRLPKKAQRERSNLVPSGQFHAVIDPEKTIDPATGKRYTKTVPILHDVQATPGFVLSRLDKESKAAYDERLAAAEDDWDQLWAEHLKTVEEAGVGAFQKSTPRLRGAQKVVPTGANRVSLTPAQQGLGDLGDEIQILQGKPKRTAEQQALLDSLLERAGTTRSTGDTAYERHAQARRESRNKRYRAADVPDEYGDEDLDISGSNARLSTKEKGLTGEHRRVSQSVRANTGFCLYCGSRTNLHGEHAIPRSRGGGAEHLVSACAECNNLKGEKSLLDFIQNPKRPDHWPINAHAAHKIQQELHPERMWDMDVGIKGSAKGEGLPVEVPDVRDIAESLGMTRGFTKGRPRLAISAGVLAKMRNKIKGSDVEQAAHLIGTSYVDAVGRQLDVIDEAVMAEGKATANSFKTVRPSRDKRLQERLAIRNRMRLGFIHGSAAHGLGLSTPSNAIAAGYDDVSALLETAGGRPNFRSFVGDPAAGFAAYGVSLGGNVGRRAFHAVRNPNAILRGTKVAPAQAQAADQDWASASDADKRAVVDAFTAEGIPLPDYMQAFANQQATGQPTGPAGRARRQQLHLGRGFGAAGGGSQFVPGGQPRWNAMAAGGRAAMGFVPAPGFVNAGAGGGGGVPPFQQMGMGFAPPPPPGGGGGAGAGAAVPPPWLPLLPRFGESAKAIRVRTLKTAASVGDWEQAYRDISTDQEKVEESFTQAQERILGVRSQIAEDIQKTPVRALSVAVGQYMSTLFGRGEVLERKREAEAILRLASKQYGLAEAVGVSYVNKKAEIAGLKAIGAPPEKIAQAVAESEYLDAETKGYTLQAQENEKHGTAAAKEVAPLKAQLVNLVTGTIGIIGGTLLFQGTMAAASAAMEALAPVIADLMERATGFSGTIRMVQDEMAKAALPTGDVQAAAAGRLSAAGLGGGVAQKLTPLLEDRAKGVVASQRTQIAIDTMRVAGAARIANAKYKGSEASFYETTGGLAGTFIGGQAPITELIGNELVRYQQQVGADNAFRLEPGPVSGALGPALSGYGRPRGEAQQQQKDYIQSLNDAMKRGGGTAQFTLGGGHENWQDTLKQTQLLRNVIGGNGARVLADAIGAGAAALKDSSGAIITNEKGLRGAIDALGSGQLLPDAGQYLQSIHRQVEAAKMGINDTFKTATQYTQPIAFYRQRVMNQPQAFGTGLAQDEAGRAAYEEFASRAIPAEAAAARQAAIGRQRAIEMGARPDDLRQLENYGKTIHDIQLDLTNKQVVIQAYEYNQQLTISKRNLSDIVGLTGTQGQLQASTVGTLEKQNLELSREATRIQRGIEGRGLAMSQRQINFQLAVAGFTAAGATPAEAAAQLEQAKLEFAFAQEQLDAQKQLFGISGQEVTNQIKIVDEENLRALDAAIFAVNDLQANHVFDQFSIAAGQAIDKISQSADILSGVVDASIAKGLTQRDLDLQIIRDTYTNTGEILTMTSADIGRAFKAIRDDFVSIFGPFLGISPTTTPIPFGGPGSQPSTENHFASGYLGNVSGAHQITVGEAGTETVAILRNPRPMMSSGYNDSGPVTIHFNNPVVREDADIQRLAAAVESVLNRRANLIGMRR